MKILYIGNYRDGTGYSQAAIDYILSLKSIGVDVVSRPIKLNDTHTNIPQEILDLENKSAIGADIVIQHTLPHYMEYSSNFKKNIGLFAWETSNFKDCSWADNLNLLDEVWVINNQQKEACLTSGVKKPIKVVPHAVDVEKFQQNYNLIKEIDEKKSQGDFIFYFIGEFNKRKNISCLLRAFHSEFDNYENVQLVIKTNGDKSEIHKYCDNIKSQLKLRRNYKQEIVITDRLTELSMRRLHYSCDCFVTASFGEAWSIPAFDALGFGNTPIVPNSTGFTTYINDEVGFLVDVIEEPVYAYTDTFEDLYTSNENWWNVNINDLRTKMRRAYELKQASSSEYEQKRSLCMSRAYDFSYEAVGRMMKGYLNDKTISDMARSDR